MHIHDDYFSPDEQDSVWIADVGKRGWAVLTKDRKIRYQETERMAVRSAGTALFVLISGDLQGKEMAAVFVRALPGIKRFLAAHQPPFIAKVYRDGRTVMSADLA